MSGVAEELIRESRVARATGTEVKLIDADHPECTDYDSAEGGRWVTECADHGSFVQHETWKLARSHLGHPEEWCATCQGTDPPPEGAGAGFSEEERQRGLATRRKKAEERRAQQNEEVARRQAKRDLEQQWTDWTVGQPLVNRLYLPEEKEAHEAAHKRMTDAKAAAVNAKRGRQAAEQTLRDLPKPKTKRERANVKRLEDEASGLDSTEVAQADAAKIAEAEAAEIARVALLRGCFRAGWRIVRDSGWHIEKADRRVRIPDDFFADPSPALFAKAEELPEGQEVQSDD